MALKLINLHTQSTFVWSQDPAKGTDEETRFQYRPLDAYEQAYLQDRISTIEKLPEGLTPGMSAQEVMAKTQTRTEVNKVAVEAVRIACTGFDNLQDHEGNPVVFETENANIAGRTKPVMSAKVVSALPIGLLLEFYMNIMGGAGVSESAEKNSGQGSSRSNSSRKETAEPAP